MLEFQIIEGDFPAPRYYQVTVAMGQKHILYQNLITVTQKHERVYLSIPTPPLRSLSCARIPNCHSVQ